MDFTGAKNIIEKLNNKLHSAIRDEVSMFIGIILFFAVGYLINDSLGVTIIQKAYGFIRLTSELALWFISGNLIYGLYALIKRRKIEYFKVHCIWILILLVISLPYIPKLLGYRSTQIGNFYEAATYTEKYVVFMSTEPEKNENRKVYTLPAQISRFPEELDSEIQTNYITGERSENPKNRLCYHIDKLYFNTGGYIDFTKVESYLTILELNVETKVHDVDGNSYFIKLSSQKAE